MQSRYGQIDFILVGAGAANAVLAWFLKEHQPNLRIKILEAESRLPPDRTWSFHGSDLGEHLSRVMPLVSRTWDGHEVRFPNRRREFTTKYHSIRPSQLEERLKELLGDDLHFSTPVHQTASDHVVLEDGRILKASTIIDGRGAKARSGQGYQKFLGLHVRTQKPHGLNKVLLMDATVEQKDGLRFFYVLPWGPRELLIEDTRYSNDPFLSVTSLTEDIHAYARARSWEIEEVLSVEQGVLEIPLNPIPRPTLAAPAVGMAAGFFHPVTGFSIPDSVRVAARISRMRNPCSASVAQELETYACSRKSADAFFLGLNRMMFLAARPEERYKVFQHFYKLPEKTIQGFYRGEAPWTSRLRILTGRPPVPIHAALKSLRSK